MLMLYVDKGYNDSETRVIIDNLEKAGIEFELDEVPIENLAEIREHYKQDLEFPTLVVGDVFRNVKEMHIGIFAINRFIIESYKKTNANHNPVG